MFDETIRQETDDGVPFVKVLEAAGVIPGIKADTGAKLLAAYPGETVTELYGAPPAAICPQTTAGREEPW